MSLNREVRIASDAMREDGDDLIVELAFASEEPYERWWGVEVLSCRQESCRVDRLNDGASLLFNHNWDDLRGVHMPNSVTFDSNGVARCSVRITGATQIGRETIALVKSGVLTKVSTGYQIHKIIEESTTKSGEKVSRELDGAIFNKSLERSKLETPGDVSAFYRDLDEKAGKFERADDSVSVFKVVDWEPLENSLVTVPADPTVGVGRNAEVHLHQHQSQPKQEQKIMAEVIDVQAHEQRGAAAAQDAVKQILAMGKQYKCADLAAEAIQQGKSVEEFKGELIEKMANKPLESAEIGLTKKEANHFSFVRAMNALANPTDRKAQEAAKFEREVSDAFGSRFGKAAQGIYVPLEVQRRDLTVGTTTAGGHTVDTLLLAQSFIDLLRNKMMVRRMGAQVLGGLTGSIAIPRQTGGATAYWVAESGSPTESQQAFDQVTMAPKTLGAFTDISRKLLLQSSLDVEMFVQNDLATVIALEIDRAAIAGTGASNQPTGILSTAGIGDVAGGTNGLAPTWAHVVELWSDLASANADYGSMGILTNPKVIGKFLTTLKAAGVAGFIAEGFPDAEGFVNVSGLRGGVSNQVPSNLTKGTSSGVCSAIISGNWNDLIIGQWGSLDLIVDPYTSSTSGTVRVVALQDVDIAVRHAESFSAMKDALTT